MDRQELINELRRITRAASELEYHVTLGNPDLDECESLLTRIFSASSRILKWRKADGWKIL